MAPGFKLAYTTGIVLTLCWPEVNFNWSFPSFKDLVTERDGQMLALKACLHIAQYNGIDSALHNLMATLPYYAKKNDFYRQSHSYVVFHIRFMWF